MAKAFTATERHALERALAEDGEPECPACGTRLSQRLVPPSKQVSYVRRRVWLLCHACGRTGAVDVRGQRGSGESEGEPPRGGGPR